MKPLFTKKYLSLYYETEMKNNNLCKIFFLFIFIIFLFIYRFINAETKSFNKNKFSKKIFEKIILNVPFTAQAPYGNWKDSRFQDGCEEASVLMAMYWVNNKILSKKTASKLIKDISAYQKNKYGNYYDTSSADTVKRIFKEYFKYHNVKLKTNITTKDIIKELRKRNLILVPVNGRKLNNIYYTPPGPERHMLVIKGWNAKTQNFITNDSGTRRGFNYKYSKNVLFRAIRDYKTGYHEKIDKIQKVMIVVSKNSKILKER